MIQYIISIPSSFFFALGFSINFIAYMIDKLANCLLYAACKTATPLTMKWISEEAMEEIDDLLDSILEEEEEDD